MHDEFLLSNWYKAGKKSLSFFDKRVQQFPLTGTVQIVSIEDQETLALDLGPQVIRLIREGKDFLNSLDLRSGKISREVYFPEGCSLHQQPCYQVRGLVPIDFEETELVIIFSIYETEVSWGPVANRIVHLKMQFPRVRRMFLAFDMSRDIRNKTRWIYDVMNQCRQIFGFWPEVQSIQDLAVAELRPQRVFADVTESMDMYFTPWKNEIYARGQKIFSFTQNPNQGEKGFVALSDFHGVRFYENEP